MSEPARDKMLAVQLTVEELSAIVQDAVKSAMKSAPKEDRLLTVEELCETLNVTEQWIYHNAKKLPFTRKIGGNLRFSSNDLQRWIAAQKFQDARLKKVGS